MKVGVIVPQGWTGEYAGVEPVEAWRRSVEVAQRAERAGADSIWLFDHFHTTPHPTDEITFEAFTALSALTMATSRAGLGHIVTCAAYRNPALEAKMISTMDVISGGRMTLGIGAGWKREEWEAYGYAFPPIRERLDLLEESLEVITRMLAADTDRATFEGERVSVRGAINLPKPVQRKLPIMVGGNGRERTWRIAARFADELNVDGMAADEIPEAMTVIRARCDEIDRDPSTLAVSAHLWWGDLEAARSRRDFIAAYADTGLSRVMALVREAARDPGEIERFLEDAAAAGCELVAASGARG